LYLCRYANFEAATYQRLIPLFLYFFIHKICFLIFFIFY